MMEEYKSNANQRRITVHKQLSNDECKDNYYAKINLKALQKAMSKLTPKAFELWIYMNKNIDNHTFWLSKVNFFSWANYKNTSYYNAFRELVAKGYLVEKEKDSNEFDFYEMSKEEM